MPATKNCLQKMGYTDEQIDRMVANEKRRQDENLRNNLIGWCKMAIEKMEIEELLALQAQIEAEIQFREG